jgi:hypothetical protein
VRSVSVMFENSNLRYFWTGETMAKEELVTQAW